MLLPFLILLPSIILADEARDLATKLDNNLYNADTVEKIASFFIDPFEQVTCSNVITIHHDENYKQALEHHLKIRKQPDNKIDKAMSKRQIEDCKLDPVSKDLEFIMYLPTHKAKVLYQAKLFEEEYKITLTKIVMQNGIIC